MGITRSSPVLPSVEPSRQYPKARIRLRNRALVMAEHKPEIG
jgi:hypothetical protein